MASFARRVIVDIGSCEIRIGEVVADRKGAPVARNLRSQDLQIDPTKASEFFPAILQGLENVVRASGIKPGPATLCLGGPSVFTRVIKIPQTDPNQVKMMVGFEAQQAVPAIDEACWDFQLFSAGGGGEVEAMILAIKKDSIEELGVAAARAGLQVEGVELAPASIINAFRYNYPEMQSSTLILDIGARSTNIIMIEGAKIFCRIVPLGGASLTQSIANDLQESFAGAETLKKAKGFVHPGGSYETPADEVTAQISKLSRGVVTRLHTEVERSITFYRSQQGGGRPTMLLLAGGGANLGLVDFFFREKLKIPVGYFQPFRRLGIGDSLPLEVQKTFPSWTCWVGTALRTLPDSPCRFNIMASLKNTTLAKGKDRPAMIATLVALGLLLFLPGLHGVWLAEKVVTATSPQKAEVEQAEETASKIQSNQKKITDRLGRMEAALRLEEERLRWPRLLGELAKKSKPGMWLTKISIVPDASHSQEQGGPNKAAKVSAKIPQLEISGIFETKSEEADAEVVDQFKRSLEEGGLLQKVVILERETPERAADGKTEQVALKFSFRADWPLEEAVDPKAGPKKQP